MVLQCYKYALFNMNVHIQNVCLHCLYHLGFHDIKEYFHQLLICLQRSNKNITLKNYDQIFFLITYD